jgi:Tol biopolymer transport system component
VTTTGATGNAYGDSISADGRYVAFTTSSSNLLFHQLYSYPGVDQIDVKDMDTGAIETLTDFNFASGGVDGLGNASMDCDGNIVAFVSNKVFPNSYHNYMQDPAEFDVFYYKLGWDANEIVDGTANYTPMDANSWANTQVSCNGNDMLYSAMSDNAYLLYEFDRLNDKFTLVSQSTSGAQSDQPTGGYDVSLSDDGRYVAFTSYATNLDTSYPNTYEGTKDDVYIRDTVGGTTQLVSFTALGNMSGLAVGPVALSTDGSHVAYEYATPSSSNTNGELISGVATGEQDIYESATGL